MWVVCCAVWRGMVPYLTGSCASRETKDDVSLLLEALGCIDVHNVKEDNMTLPSLVGRGGKENTI